MDQTLINMALALATNELLHNIMEVSSIRNKVARLQAYVDKKEYKEMPMNIDTRPKAYAISAVAFVVLVGILFGVYSIFNINADTAIKIIIGLLVVTYIVTVVTVDKYHIEIEKVTRLFKK